MFHSILGRTSSRRIYKQHEKPLIYVMSLCSSSFFFDSEINIEKLCSWITKLL